MHVENFLISMAEPSTVLCQAHRQAVRESLNRPHRSPFKNVELDPIPVLTSIIEEIQDQGMYQQGQSWGTAVDHLVAEGFGAVQAQALALEAFHSAIGIIGTLLPDITFGDTKRYLLSIVEGGDLMVSRLPYTPHQWKES